MTAYVGLPLIPDETAGRVTGDRLLHRVIHRRRAFPVFLVGVVFLAFDTPAGIAVDRRLRQPAFYAAASVGACDNAYRHIENPVERLGEMPRQSAELRCSSGGRHLPRAADSVHDRVAAPLRDGCHSDAVFPLAREDNLFLRALDRLGPESAEGHLHIRLARSDPHFADEHILHCCRGAVAIGDGDFIRGIACRWSCYRSLPPAVAAGLYNSFRRSPRRSDLYLRAGFGASPEAHIGLLLKHGIVAKLGGHLDARHCGGRQCQHRNKPDRIKFFHAIGER